MRILLTLTIFLAFKALLFAEQKQKKPFVVVNSCVNCGMFRTFASLTGLLHLYEEGHYSGVKVDFGSMGLYHDTESGPNWWEYYFEPICVGSEVDAIPFYTVNGPDGIDCAMLTEFSLNRHQVNQIIRKYIQLKPHMEDKIDRFTNEHFKGDIVIGVHYRGTDKTSEAPRVSFERMASLVIKQTVRHGNKRVRIFLASDELGFLEYMHSLFPARLCFRNEAIHSTSGQPIHLTSEESRKMGEDAVIDCLLLSKCDVLIKTSSNLSLFSAYFNPDMPVIHASTRPRRTPLN